VFPRNGRNGTFCSSLLVWAICSTAVPSANAAILCSHSPGSSPPVHPSSSERHQLIVLNSEISYLERCASLVFKCSWFSSGSTSLPCFCWYLAWLTLRPWRWRRCIPPTRWAVSELHSVTTQEPPPWWPQVSHKKCDVCIHKMECFWLLVQVVHTILIVLWSTFLCFVKIVYSVRESLYKIVWWHYTSRR
jgi:hypothetical protein